MRKSMILILLLLIPLKASGLETKREMCEPTADFFFAIWEAWIEEDDGQARAKKIQVIIQALVERAQRVYGDEAPEVAEIKLRSTDYWQWLESTRHLLYSYIPAWERLPSDLYWAHERTERDLWLFGRIRDFCDPTDE